MTRILHVSPSIDPRYGGPTNALFAWAAAQVTVGDAVSILSTFKDPAELVSAARLERAGIQLINVGPCTGPLRRHRDLARIAKERISTADVVHIHGMWEEIQHCAAQIATALDIPFVVTPHGMLDPWSLAQSRWKKRMYLAWRLRRNLSRATAIHFTTATECEMVRPLKIGVRSIVEPLGVDLREFETLPVPGTFTRGYPELAGRPIVMFLGRVRPGKGFEYLIPAFAKCGSPNAMLVIVGPDELNHHEWCKKEAARCGVLDRMLLTGMLEGSDRVAALADATVFVLPSDHENFGVSVIESLAAGTPVIVSDHVYIHDQIVGGGVGAVVPRDVDRLATEIGKWLNPSESMEARSNSRPFVWRNFDWKVIADRWQKYYAELVAPP